MNAAPAFSQQGIAGAATLIDFEVLEFDEHAGLNERLVEVSEIGCCHIGTIPIYQPPSRRRRRMSLSTALKRARALGVDVTVAGDGSVTFKTSVENAQNAQTEHDAMSDLDRELEEFEASHEA